MSDWTQAWQKLLLIGIAGGCGALARYGLAGVVQKWLGPGFPWGTAAVNLLGCFLFGIIWASTEGRWTVSPDVRAMVLTGFMGAFTTFSTFIAETGQLVSESEYLFGFLNVGSQVLIGLLAFFIGASLGRNI